MRMSYSRKKEVLDMPNLIEVQRDSYQWFLDEGLSEAFADISPITDLREIKTAIFSLLKENSDESGWMFLGELGNMVLKLYPDFDCRNYGYAKLSNLLESFRDVEIRRENAKDSHNQLVYVRKRD